MAEALAVVGVVSNIVQLVDFKQTQVAIEKGAIRDETKQALVPVVDGCRTQVEVLDGIIEKALPLPGDSWRRKGSKAITSLWQDSKVKNITTDLRNYIQSLTYYHAATSSTLHAVNSKQILPALRYPLHLG